MLSYLVAGTGGAGKTSVSAALGLALARSGERTLVVTLDPARRLADAFGVAPSTSIQRLQPHLDGWMPTAESALDDVVARRMPSSGEALQRNSVFRALHAAPSGMHEISVAMRLVDEAPRYDALVLDTAPSRHALDFLQTPARISSLLAGRSLRFFGAFSRSAPRVTSIRPVRRALSRVLPAEVIEDGAAFFVALSADREPLLAAAQQAAQLLSASRRMLVVGPSDASLRGALTLYPLLAQGNAVAVLLNRLGDELDHELADLHEPSGDLAALLPALRHEASRRARIRRSALGHFPNAAVLPDIAGGARDVVEGLAGNLTQHAPKAAPELAAARATALR